MVQWDIGYSGCQNWILRFIRGACLLPRDKLIVTNCAIVARAEIFASRNSVASSMLDGLAMGGGFALLLCALGCAVVARGLSWRSARAAALGVGLAWALFAAALLDAVENYALIQLLLGASSEHWAPLAGWCALPKFAIVAAGLVYLLAGGAWIALARDRAGAAPVS